MDLSALVSVIVPVYKVEDYLDRAVQSIVDQSYGNLEIILVDDGSPDRCPAICDAWAQRDPRIRVIHKENGGVSSARNAGLRVAVGDWISFVDSDDWIHPQFFELLIGTGKNCHANVVSAQFVKTENEIEYVEIPVGSVTTVSIAPSRYNSWKNRFVVWGKIYKKEVLSDLQFDESLAYGEDVCFNILLLNQPDIIVVEIEAVLYFYLIRSGSLSSCDRIMKRVALCNTALSYAEKDTNEKRRSAFIIYALKRALSTRFDVRRQRECSHIKKQCNEVLSQGLRELKKTNAFADKEFLRYYAFYRMPVLYSAFRFLEDPASFRKRNQVKTNS